MGLKDCPPETKGQRTPDQITDLLPAALVVGTAVTVTGRRVVLAEGDTRCWLLRARELLEKTASGGGMKQEAGRSQALSSSGSLSAALVLLATSLWALNLS
ncbi:uncharacterized protein ACIBXB_018609 isoform 4-T6 [Morphnus guianensis]